MKSATFSTGKPPLFSHSFNQSQMYSTNSKTLNTNFPLHQFYDQLEILMSSTDNFKAYDSTNEKKPLRRQVKRNLSINQVFLEKQGKNDPLILQYENALNKIQASLIEKQFEINKKWKQFEIQVQQKEKFIEEKIKQYEVQLQNLLNELQNKNKNALELEKKVGQYELQLQNIQIKNKSLVNSEKNLREQYDQQSKQLIQLKKKIQINENKVINKQQIKQYQNQIKQMNFQLQKLKKQLQHTLNEIEIKQNKLILKDKKIEDLTSQNIKLCSEMNQLSNDIKFRNQFKVLLEQSQKNLAENYKLKNFMENQIQNLKKQNIKLTKKQQNYEVIIKKLQNNNEKLQFQKTNLYQYNKVLLNKLNSKDQILYTKVFGKSNSTFHTITN